MIISGFNRPSYCVFLPCFLQFYIGDFGNAVHVTALSEYFETFDIQTLVYRAPEVLLGLPFNQQIDMYSLGLVLLELWTGQPFFTSCTRQEHYSALCKQLTPPPRVYFSCGKFFDDLEKSHASAVRPTVVSQGTFSITDHVKAVKRAMSKTRGDCTPQLVNFIARMLHPEPAERLSPFEALHHDFLAATINVPLNIIESGRSIKRSSAASISSLRINQTVSLKRYHGAATNTSSRTISSPVPAAVSSANSFSHLQVKVPYSLAVSADREEHKNSSPEAKEQREHSRHSAISSHVSSDIIPDDRYPHDDEESSSFDRFVDNATNIGSKRQRKIFNYSMEGDDFES